MEVREQWDEMHAEMFDKLSDSCDEMAREWSSKHCIEGYQMAAKIMIQKEVYRNMAYGMRQPRFIREENKEW